MKSKIVEVLATLPWLDVTGDISLDKDAVQTLASGIPDRDGTLTHPWVFCRYDDENQPFALVRDMGGVWKTLTTDQELMGRIWEQVCPKTS